MTEINTKLLSRMQTVVPHEIIDSWVRRYKQDQENDHKKINTPATNATNTSWRKEGGSAIQKMKKKRLIKQQAVQNQKEVSPQINDKLQAEEQQADNNSKVGETARIVLKGKAVFFGQDCELPYLHSSDAITHLYSRKNKQNDCKQQILFNPSSSIDRSYLTGLKSLHIYHTQIQSLRQLGTGWCNLKELSILYGRLSDLSGLSSFSSLQYLFLAFNGIQSLSDLMFHPTLKIVDMQRNKIESMDEVEYLLTMDKLQSINLNGNPVMKIKENKRLIQQKMGKMLELQQYTRLQEYQNLDLSKYHELISFQKLQATNYLMKICNQLLFDDQISLQQLEDSYRRQLSTIKDQSQLEIVSYSQKIQPQESFSQQIFQRAEENINFTPLRHFLSGKKIYTNTLKKYMENRIYLNLKKTSQQISQQTSQKNSQTNLRLNRLTTSTKLEREENAQSLDNGCSLTTQLNSLSKGKRLRLSIGKRNLIQNSLKPTVSLTKQIKLTSQLSSAGSSKVFSLKRTSFLGRKAPISDINIEIDKKFAKTATFNHD